MPSSARSWLTAIVSPAALTNPIRTGAEMTSTSAAARSTRSSSRVRPTIAASAPESATARLGSPPASAPTAAPVSSDGIAIGPNDSSGTEPNRA